MFKLKNLLNVVDLNIHMVQYKPGVLNRWTADQHWTLDHMVPGRKSFIYIFLIFTLSLCIDFILKKKSHPSDPLHRASLRYSFFQARHPFKIINLSLQNFIKFGMSQLKKKAVFVMVVTPPH